MRRLRIIIPAIVVLVLLVGVTVVFASRSLWAHIPLEQLALQLSEMPAGAKQLSVGRPTSVEDTGHVLGYGSAIKTGPYTECYVTSAMVPMDVTDTDGKALGTTTMLPVIQMLYRYATEAEAQAQFQKLSQTWDETAKVAILSGQIRVDKDGRQWVTARLIGSEGDTIYWYIGVKGRVLTLLCADDLQALDGRPRPSGQSLFETLVGRVLAR